MDDNPQIRSFIRPALEDNGFHCVEAVDGDEAVYEVEASKPDLIVLDIELGDPSMDGLDVCKRIRALGHTMPVIFLTVRATVEDLEYGLQLAGPGSDYVRKLQELRRMQMQDDEAGDLEIALKAPDLRLSRKSRSVERRVAERWEQVRLQPLEYEVFKVIVDGDGGVVGTWELFDRVFQGGSDSLDSSDEPDIENYKNRVWVCVANLRRKIDPDSEHDYIQTVHGIGYRLHLGDSGSSRTS